MEVYPAAGMARIAVVMPVTVMPNDRRTMVAVPVTPPTAVVPPPAAVVVPAVPAAVATTAAVTIAIAVVVAVTVAVAAVDQRRGGVGTRRTDLRRPTEARQRQQPGQHEGQGEFSGSYMHC